MVPDNDIRISGIHLERFDCSSLPVDYVVSSVHAAVVEMTGVWCLHLQEVEVGDEWYEACAGAAARRRGT